MIPMFRYIILTLKHKWFVLVAGIKLGGIPLYRLIIHDWTKLLPWDAYQYGKQFFGKKDNPEGFAIVWLRHQNAHPHHWEYWIPRTGHNKSTPGNLSPIPMPKWAIREMVVDWQAAGRAYEGKWPNPHYWEWYRKNQSKIFCYMNVESVKYCKKVVYELSAKRPLRQSI